MSTPIYKLKELTSILSTVDSFVKPKAKLEQYSTSAEVAAAILYDIQNRDDAILGKKVADLGCGPGIFSIGSALLGAGMTVGFEIDSDAIRTFQENLIQMELHDSPVDVVQCNVLQLSRNFDSSRFYKSFDTVITNPPFGTAACQKHADLDFLLTALRMSRGHVYSLHKTSTREFILDKIKSMNANAEAVAELRFDLRNTLRRHRKESVDIKVDLIHSWFPQ